MSACATATTTLHSRAVGYASDAQVWQAIRSHPGYAVVSADFAANSGNGGSSFVVHGLLATLLVGLIALHFAAALYHQLVLKDGLLRRMWFGRR